MLMDYLSNRGFRVELEKDLSEKRQPLDVVVVEQENGEPVVCGQHRHPKKVLSLPGVTKAKPGVYDLRVLSMEIRILVLSEMPTEQRNAILSLFSFDAEKVKYAVDHYQWQQEDGSTVINQLLDQYAIEGIAMPYTMEQFRKEYIKAHLGELDIDDRLKGVDPKDVLSRFDPETMLKYLDPEKIEAYLKKLKNRKMN